MGDIETSGGSGLSKLNSSGGVIKLLHIFIFPRWSREAKLAIAYMLQQLLGQGLNSTNLVDLLTFRKIADYRFTTL